MISLDRMIACNKKIEEEEVLFDYCVNSFPNSLESSKAHFDSKLLSKSTCSKASCHAIRIRFILDKRKKIKQKWHGLQFCHESIFFGLPFSVYHTYPSPTSFTQVAPD